MIVEVRGYRIRDGLRDRFLEFFEHRAVLLLGVLVLCGPAPGRAQESPAARAPAAREVSARPDCAGDFDFEFGEWTARLSRLLNPLSGSTSWVEYEGISVVRKVWEGLANLGELDVDGPAGRIQGLSLRLLDPETCQWNIHWASSRNGVLGPAMVGGFRDGIGEFYNEEEFDGRPIRVRFVFSDITPSSFHLEQAFSDDGGETWEPNWIARFERPAGQSATDSPNRVLPVYEPSSAAGGPAGPSGSASNRSM